jgi:hypothetical protein
MRLIPPTAFELLELSSWLREHRHGDVLLGFWHCSREESYYSCHINYSEDRIVPVFWCENYWSEQTGEKGNFLYFKGCDDGHFGMGPFTNKEDALQWLKNCPYVDYAQMLKDHQNFGLGLHWYN